MKGRPAHRARVHWPGRIASLEQRAASGDTSAMTDLGLNLFVRDGDAAVDVGYCFIYGIGARKNARNRRANSYKYFF